MSRYLDSVVVPSKPILFLFEQFVGDSRLNEVPRRILFCVQIRNMILESLGTLLKFDNSMFGDWR